MDKLLPCPFCGGEAKLTKHFKEEMWSLIHRCEVMGPLAINWTDKSRAIERWNTRNTVEVPVETPLELAKMFHDYYEDLAPKYGYKTRPETRVFDPESANGKLMIAVCELIYAHKGE